MQVAGLTEATLKPRTLSLLGTNAPLLLMLESMDTEAESTAALPIEATRLAPGRS